MVVIYETQSLYMLQVDRASGNVGIFPQYVHPRKKAAFGVPKREFLEVGRVEWGGVGTVGGGGEEVCTIGMGSCVGAYCLVVVVPRSLS